MRHSFERIIWRSLCCAMAASLTACAASPWSGGLAVESTPRVQGDRATGSNLLAANEIDAAKVSTAYDAIVSRRPRFLSANQSRGSDRAAVAPSVVVERGLPEPLAVLKSISASEIAEIRYLEPWESTTKFGSEYTAGVIVVRLRALH
jgi:hypothetical protein